MPFHSFRGRIYGPTVLSTGSAGRRTVSSMEVLLQNIVLVLSVIDVLGLATARTRKPLDSYLLYIFSYPFISFIVPLNSKRLYRGEWGNKTRIPHYQTKTSDIPAMF